jgi:hypothetical protein
VEKQTIITSLLIFLASVGGTLGVQWLQRHLTKASAKKAEAEAEQIDTTTQARGRIEDAGLAATNIYGAVDKLIETAGKLGTVHDALLKCEEDKAQMRIKEKEWELERLQLNSALKYALEQKTALEEAAVRAKE